MTDHDTRAPSGTPPADSDRSRPTTHGGRVILAVGAACLVCCLPPLLAAAGWWMGVVTVAGVWAGPTAPRHRHIADDPATLSANKSTAYD